MTKFVIYSSINQFFHYFIDSDIISYPSCLVTNNFIKQYYFLGSFLWTVYFYELLPIAHSWYARTVLIPCNRYACCCSEQWSPQAGDPSYEHGPSCIRWYNEDDWKLEWEIHHWVRSVKYCLQMCSEELQTSGNKKVVCPLPAEPEGIWDWAWDCW